MILTIGVARFTEEKDVLKLYSNMIEKMSKGLTRPFAAVPALRWIQKPKILFETLG